MAPLLLPVGTGIYGINSAVTGTGNGVIGSVSAGGSAYGVWGINTGGGYAGVFSGNVSVNGTLSKSAGSFKIDHPLDPANKYLSHSFVESPDMKNIYDGVAELDESGEAWIDLPEYFEALNRDFRYQLTCMGEFAPVYIAKKIAGNRFKIAGGAPGVEVLLAGYRHPQGCLCQCSPHSRGGVQERSGSHLFPAS